jgi:Photosynthesis system II assembly factor YCF48
VTDPRDQLDDWLATEVTPLEPPPGTLGRIGRRARQRKTRQVVVASAACAVLLGAAVAAPQIAASFRSAKHPPVAGQISPPVTKAPGARPTSGGANSETQSAGPIQLQQRTTLSTTTSGTAPPPHFRPTSVTFVGTGNGLVGAVIGQAGPPCATADCTSLAGTSNYGQSWYGVSAPVAPAPTGDAGVSQLAFANLHDGWAFGPALYETSGGGWPWRQENTNGQDVISLAASPTAALAIFGTCTGTGTLYATGCTSYALYGSAAGSTTWNAVTVPAAFAHMSASQAGSSAPLLVISGSTGYLITPSGAVLSGPVSGGTWSVVGNAPCSPAEIQLAASPSQLVATCSAAGQVTLETSASGANWQQARTTAVPGTPTSLATAASGQVVLATTAGLYYSTDGGTTWQAASVNGPAPAGGFSYVGMTNQSQGVAVPANASLGEVYVTGNGGQTWNPSPIAS